MAATLVLVASLGLSAAATSYRVRLLRRARR
jgi:hypothetical protein